ncbi:MAG: D-alanyl-D-alanine carboxypeptidase family protein [Oscillospiraceae bacterium]
MLKKLISLVIVCALCSVTVFGWEKPDSFEVTAKGCIIMEKETKRVLFAHNAYQKLPMASTTKIMSAWLALEQTKLDEQFAADTSAIHVEGSSMGLTDGDIVTMRSLAYGMLLPSGNDAANAAAVRIDGITSAFVQRMNERAKEIGMDNTHFMNPSGLDAEGHYSTAYDMALLTANALDNKDFAGICSKSKAQLEFGNPPFKRWLFNNNKLLSRYEGCIGVKTGFTDNARRCLVTAAERDGITLICVTLNCGDDWNIHSSLYDKYFEQLKNTDVSSMTPELTVPIIGGNLPYVSAEAVKKPIIALKAGEMPTIKTEVILKPLEFAPINAGQYLGELSFTLDGEKIFTTPLIAEHDVISTSQSKNKTSLWSRIKDKLNKNQN